MSSKKLGIITVCIVVVVVIIVVVTRPLTPGFSIDVIPRQLNGDSIAGQRCVFLVTFTEEGEEEQHSVHISATAPGAEIVTYFADILEGEVAEVVVIPAQQSVESTIEVTITGTRGRQTDKEVVSFDVVEGEDDRQGCLLYTSDAADE